MPIRPHEPYDWINEPILVVAYDSSWVQRANKLIEALTTTLHPWLTGTIEHVGSTAVPGLNAKPVIDVMAPVESFAITPDIEAALAPAEWHWMSPAMDGRSAERRIFVQVLDGHRHAHLHLARMGGSYWHELLTFRDRLRRDRNLAAQYDALKRRLASESQNRDAYTAGKSEFVAEALARGAQ